MSSTKDFAFLGTGTLSVLVACTDPIVGDWTLTDLPPEGLTYDYTYHGYDSGCGNSSETYEWSIAGELSIDEELRAEFTLELDGTYTYTSDNCGTHTEDLDLSDYGDTFEGQAEQTDKGEYKIELEGDEDSLDLTCTLNDDEDELECESDTDKTLVFGRKGE